MDLREKKRISRKQKNVLKKVEGSNDLKLSGWRTRTGVSIFQVKEFECEEDKIVIERWSSSQRGGRAVWGYVAGKSAETLTLYWTDISRQVLRCFGIRSENQR